MPVLLAAVLEGRGKVAFAFGFIGFFALICLVFEQVRLAGDAQANILLPSVDSN